MRKSNFRLFDFIGMAIICVLPLLAQSPQIPLSGSIGVPGNVALLGGVTVQMPSDANYTLTPAQWANKTLIITSAVPLTAPRNIIGPANLGQEFNVQNNTTGAQFISILGPTGVGVTIGAANSATVFFNGTDYVQVSSNHSATTAAFDHTPTLCGTGLTAGGIDTGGNAINCLPTGSSTPGGTNGDVQLNNGGALGADTGNFGYNLSTHTFTPTNINNGRFFTSQITNNFLNSDTYGNIAAALVSPDCATNCNVIRSPFSLDTSVLPLPPSGDSIFDYAHGTLTTVAHNPLGSLAYRPGTPYDCFNVESVGGCSTGIFDTPNPFATNPDLANPTLWGGAATYSKWSWNYGNCPNCGNTQWGPAGRGLEMFMNFNSAGISQGFTMMNVKHAIGDFAGGYFYNWTDGGQPDYSGEGFTNLSLQGGETSDFFHGFVGTGATTGSTFLPITLNSGATLNRNATSAGAFLIDVSQPALTGHVTGVDITPPTPMQTYGISLIPIDTTVTPSTAYGNTGCAMTVPVATNPNIPGSITCTINNIQGSASGTTGFVVGLAELSGDFPEQVNITAAPAPTGSGTTITQQVTFTYVHPHGATNTMLWQGSNVIGTFLNYDQLTSIQGFKSLLHVYGATDASHIVAENTGGGIAPNPYVTPAVTSAVTRTGTLVTAAVPSGAVSAFGQYSVTPVISGCSDSTMNGQVSAFTQNFTNLTIGWTSPNSGTTSCTSVNVGLPTSYYAFTLYPGAAQRGPAITAPGNLYLEPNGVAWNPGDQIEMPHHMDWAGTDFRTTLNVVNPLASYRGNANGTGHIYTGLGVGNQFKPFQLGINNPCSYYIGCGGQLNAPYMMIFGVGGNPYNGGVNGGGMRLGEAPLNGASAVSVGCPDPALGGCASNAPISFLTGSYANSQLIFYPDIGAYSAANFIAGQGVGRGFGQMKGGLYQANGVQQQPGGGGFGFSDDGINIRNHLSLCQYDTNYNLVVGTCGNGAAGSVTPNGGLQAANLTGQASVAAGTLTVGLQVPNYVLPTTYSGTAGTTQRQYALTAVSPLGIEGMAGFHNTAIMTAATLDGSDFVTITCPPTLQANYPAGTTYKVYENTHGYYVGTCPVGGTAIDNGAGVTQQFRARNGNSTSLAGQFQMDSDGSVAWYAGPLAGSTLDTFITRAGVGTLNIGTTKGASNGVLNVGTINATTLNGAISGAQITSGTIADAQLSSNVPLKNATTNAFTGTVNANQLGSATGVQISNPMTSVNCSTSGTVEFSTPFSGNTNFKVSMAVLNACVGTANYPLANPYTFAGNPFYSSNVSASNVTVSASGSTFSLTATAAASGSILVMGY